MQAVEERGTKRFHLVLQKRADRLTGDDLLKITEVAEEAGAAIHISNASWQVLVGVPDCNGEEVLRRLHLMGFTSFRKVGEINPRNTFALEAG
jgi:hypothetical protein